MKAFLQIKKEHSNKKDVDYIATYLHMGSRKYFINLNYEALSLVLNLNQRELEELPVGYTSKEYDLNLGD